MLIRILTPADATVFFKLRIESLEREPRAFAASAEEDAAMPLETVAARLQAVPEGTFTAGAFEQGELIGIAGFHRAERLKMRHKGDIWGVYVKPEWRGRGIARQMLSAILDRLRSYPTLDHVLLHVSDSQAGARRLYESLGFETCGHERRAHKVGGDYVDQYQMVLFLKA